MDVLIGDDNRDAAESLMDLIKVAGCREWVAENGEEALQIHRRQKPGLVFMDLKRPGIGGAKATQEICRLDSNAKVVLVTGNPMKKRTFRVGSSSRFGGAKKTVRPEDCFGNGGNRVSPMILGRKLMTV